MEKADGMNEQMGKVADLSVWDSVGGLSFFFFSRSGSSVLDEGVCRRGGDTVMLSKRKGREEGVD